MSVRPSEDGDIEDSQSGVEMRVRMPPPNTGHIVNAGYAEEDPSTADVRSERLLRFENLRFLLQILRGHGPDPDNVMAPFIENVMSKYVHVALPSPWIAWVEIVEQTLREFESLSFGRVLRLAITVIECHQLDKNGEPSYLREEKFIQTFGEFDKYLTQNVFLLRHTFQAIY